MPNRRHYNDSPIKEAVIDIRCELPHSISVELLERIGHEITNDYPHRQDVHFLQGKFSIGAEATSTQTKLGFVYRSTDEKYLAQVRTNGFTFSRLTPYDSWEPFRSEAKRLWDIYESIAKPVRIIRVASRSINRIDIPGTQTELKDYFKTFPELSSELPQLMSGFVMQVLIPQTDFGGMLSLIQASVPAPQSDISSINLDIDMYKESTTDFDSSAAAWEFLDALRDRKNAVFEGCITDRARELFGPIT